MSVVERNALAPVDLALKAQRCGPSYALRIWPGPADAPLGIWGTPPAGRPTGAWLRSRTERRSVRRTDGLILSYQGGIC